MNTMRDTLIPASYPELDADAQTRDTLIPPESVQMTLELECMGFEEVE